MTADGRFINRVTSGGDAAGGAEAPGSEPVGRGALTKQVLVEGDDFAVVDLRCRRDRDRWSTRAPIEEPAIVFVRRGCFYRRVDGVESVMDPTVVFFESPGQERMLRHPFVGGDACTWILLSAGLLASVWADVEIPLLAPLPTSAEIDLEHRLLLRAATAGADLLETEERVILLVSHVLGGAAPARVSAGRPATAAARRRLADAARAAIAAEPRIGLIELARRLAVSPHHLSRLFRAGTGETVSEYRNRIRVRLALERLAEGDRRLARLAAELGFSDHAHLTRVVRREAGAPPALLRALLGPPAIRRG